MRFTYKHLILGVILALATGPAYAAGALLEMVAGAGSDPTVLVKRGGKSLQLKKGAALESGDELITDRAGAVDIRLEDKSLLRVGSNSSYRLEENSSTHQFIHRLISGIVRVLVPKGEKAAAMKLEVRTAEGTIGVRGTEFVVIRNGSATELKGLE
ncbi:MAG: hypothetical protein EOP11_18450, partial [Proteobacteria bacterium]